MSDTQYKNKLPVIRFPEKADLFCNDLPTKPRPDIGRVLVTGATGYIGGRLVPELLDRGYRVRVMVRGSTSERASPWPGMEIVEADALDLSSLKKVLTGIDTAYYLIHSLMRGPKEFESADLQAAVNFRKAAEENEVKRIIYLGGLGEVKTLKSPHLQSRIQVAEELLRGKVPVTILRAAIIIGSGSASYEIIHNLVNKLPLLPLPHWARSRCQPIGIRDVIKYLVGVLEIPQTSGRNFDIGGKDILTYEMMLKVFAGIVHKRRLFLLFPISNIWLYAYFASLITPVPDPITLSLMEGVRDEVICRNEAIKDYLPFEPLTYQEAIVRALTREEQDKVYTRWSDAYPPAHELAIKLHELKEAPKYTTSYSLLSGKSASSLFNSICRIGGKTGWFNNNWLWRLRGAVDRILIGVGSSRGRRSYSSLSIDDVVDFWRVEDIRQDRRLLLRAEMKLPGKAWLEFNIDEEDSLRKLSVTPHYYTKGLLGKIYWYVFLPLHNFIFNDLIKQIEKRC